MVYKQVMTKKQYYLHKKNGLCTRCNKKVTLNQTLCKEHTKESRIRQKNFYDKHKYERKLNISLIIGGY